MSQTESDPIGQQLLAGFMTGEEIDKEMDWSPRTRARREEEGLPFVKIGGSKLYPVEHVRKWILSRMRRGTEPRARGRPRKNAA